MFDKKQQAKRLVDEYNARHVGEGPEVLEPLIEADRREMAASALDITARVAEQAGDSSVTTQWLRERAARLLQ